MYFPGSPASKPGCQETTMTRKNQFPLLQLSIQNFRKKTLRKQPTGKISCKIRERGLFPSPSPFRPRPKKEFGILPSPSPPLYSLPFPSPPPLVGHKLLPRPKLDSTLVRGEEEGEKGGLTTLLFRSNRFRFTPPLPTIQINAKVNTTEMKPGDQLRHF